MVKVLINEKKLKTLIENSVKNILNEIINNDEYSIKEYYPKLNIDDKMFLQKNKNIIWQFLNNGYNAANCGDFRGCFNEKSLVKNCNLLKIAYFNNEIIAVSVYTNYRGGNKCVGITAAINEYREIGKKAVVDIIKNDIGLYDEFYWVECSGAVESLYKKYNGIAIPNEYASIMLQKDVTIDEDGFHFYYNVSDETQKKIIYGFNSKETYDMVSSKYVEYIKKCTSVIQNDRKINESIDLSNLELNPHICIQLSNLIYDMKCDGVNEFPLEIVNLVLKIIKYMENNNHNGELDIYIDNAKDVLMYSTVMELHKW